MSKVEIDEGRLNELMKLEARVKRSEVRQREYRKKRYNEIKAIVKKYREQNRK